MFSILSNKPQESASSAPLFSVAEASAAARAKRWLKDRVERSKKGRFTEEVSLTPVLAELLLAEDVNADNRGVKWGKVEKFAAAIRRGEWEVNGQPIIVSRDGQLNDGQHRCLAVVKAGRSIDVDMKFGVERETRRTLDTGTARTLGDVLDMRAEKNSKALAAAVRMLWLYEAGRLPAIDSPTHTQAEEVLYHHPDLRNSVAPAIRVYGAMRGSLGTWAFCHYVCSSIDANLAERVFDQLATGLGYDNGKRDPVYRLREHLIGLRSSGKQFLNTWQQASLTLKLWNMKRGFERPGLPAYDPTTEAFPVAR